MRIADWFDKETADHPEWIHVRTKSPSSLPKLQIPQVFEDANDLFRKWRYHFEGSSGGNPYFFPAVPAARKTILEIKPDWEVRIEPLLRMPPTSPAR